MRVSLCGGITCWWLDTYSSDEDLHALFALFLLYHIPTVFPLYILVEIWCGPYVMMFRKPEPTLLLNQGIFNLPHHISMITWELNSDWHCTSYTVGTWIAAQINVMAVTGFVTRITKPSALTNSAISPCYTHEWGSWHSYIYESVS